METQPNKLNLMSLEEGSAYVRSLSGAYPVCIVTSLKGAAILSPILKGCDYRLNRVKVTLMTDPSCKDDAVYLLPEKQFNQLMKAKGRTA